MKLFPDVIELLTGLMKGDLPCHNTPDGDVHLIPKRISKAQLKRALKLLRDAQKQEDQYPPTAMKATSKDWDNLNTEHDEC